MLQSIIADKYVGRDEGENCCFIFDTSLEIKIRASDLGAELCSKLDQHTKQQGTYNVMYSSDASKERPH